MRSQKIYIPHFAACFCMMFPFLCPDKLWEMRVIVQKSKSHIREFLPY